MSRLKLKGKLLNLTRSLLVSAVLASSISFALATSDAGGFTANAQPLPKAQGKFRASMDSLTQYQYPSWFRDAKFGIWAHWGPQSVPMDGDWYARGIYEQGSGHYNYHIAHYGHPSTFGYKDIIPLWKAEKWDPARLMKIYKKAGAKYFVSMGSHHDNFFLWNSKLHRWNAANMGPHKDVVGIWQQEARKNGLRFGVSEHLGASFTWFQSSHGSDKTGPRAGVPYDGADPQYADLYHEPAAPGDTAWYSNNPKWQHEWYSEIKELIDNYHPDLLYSDGSLPFGNEVGLSMIAHFYNSSAAQHGGKPDVVYNCKQDSGGRWVQDLERGVMGKVNPYPWQTDTSIGDWFYNRNWKYRPINWVIDTLVDVVSKNGNLLLNVVQRPDGSIDHEVETMLAQMADWTAIHKEAIYGSRPWLVYGEGSVSARGGSFNENFGYGSQDIRFTTQGSTLYAISLAYPKDNRLLVRSLAKASDRTQNVISSVSLLGYSGKVEWTQSPKGLLVKLPAHAPSAYTAGLKIKGKNLKPVVLPNVVHKVMADSRGVLTLGAELAELHGGGIQLETKGGKPNVGYWFGASEFVSWIVKVPAAGSYTVAASISTVNEGSQLVLEAGARSLTGVVPNTGDWERFQEIGLGSLTFDRPGELVVKIRPRSAEDWKAINLRSIVLTPQSHANERALSSANYLRQMSPGWNLGNTLEALPNETSWGNPMTTQALMNGARAAGFKSVRIPAAWSQYADKENNINPVWMAHVTQVVNYARNAGLYVVLNVHWDGGWMQSTFAQQAAVNAKLKKFWTQIATNFKEFDDGLLFAGTNEVGVNGVYGPPTAENSSVQNSFNQTFVSAVRATGGKNSTRYLVIQGYNTNIDDAVIHNVVLPIDTAVSKLMMEVHYYSPYNFTLNDKSSIWQWGAIAKDPAATETWANEAYADAEFEKMKTAFVDKGVPVILGEYCAGLKSKYPGMRVFSKYWDQYITGSAFKHGLVPMFWDAGTDGGLFKRATGAPLDPDVIGLILKAAR